MALIQSHEVKNLKTAPGELSFEARIGGLAQPVWLRTETAVTPPADAALAACLMPAMREGGTIEMTDPVSPRMLRTQSEFQAIQRVWSFDWEFGDPPLEEVEVVAPTRTPGPPHASGRVATFFSGGVDSWSTVLANPDVTDLVFARGLDLVPGATHQERLGNEVEARLREAADALGLRLHVVDTNLRELSDRFVRWEAFYPSALASLALFFEPLFERVLIVGDADHETQIPVGSSRMVEQLWSTERLEIACTGGRLRREERLAAITDHPVAQRTLRVCWENRGGAYNCGRCRKCMLTMVSLEALGARGRFATFPPELDLELLAGFEFSQQIQLLLWEDSLDTVRAAGRPDLELAVEGLIAKGKRDLCLPPTHRRRRNAGPEPTIRVAVVVPVWRQARYLAGAVDSALAQEIAWGVGVVVVNDGCPDPETHRIGQALRDAHPDCVAYLHQPNRGVSAARNAGIRQAFARWPQVKAVFPLDADNLLSPHTLAKLVKALEEDPEASWATPALELFGAEEDIWQIPGPFLPYRQLFTNQCDTGSLIRRDLFEAGIEYDETMRFGFEDWELFLRATLADHRGATAGRCGFRYRRRPESMLKGALQRAAQLEAEIRHRHRDAYEPETLIRREHVEAPRFALVRCDRRDVLLTSSCDLEPRRLSLADFARSLVAIGGIDHSAVTHVPPIIVFTTSPALDRLEKHELAAALFALQGELRDKVRVGLRIDASSEGPSAIAVRAGALVHLPTGAPPHPEAIIDVDSASGEPGHPLPAPELSAALAPLLIAVEEVGWPLPNSSHSTFLEQHHLDRRETTFPWSTGNPARTATEMTA